MVVYTRLTDADRQRTNQTCVVQWSKCVRVCVWEDGVRGKAMKMKKTRCPRTDVIELFWVNSVETIDFFASIQKDFNRCHIAKTGEMVGTLEM